MTKKGEELNKILSMSIYEIGFSQRVVNALASSNLIYIKEVVKLNEGQLLRIPNLGFESLGEIRRYAEKHNIVIGVDYE